MQKIEAFQCAFCTKIYLSKETCRKHESRCFWNPKTRSCASCIFERYKDYSIMPGHSTSIRTCLRNHDISAKLKTACPDHHYKKAKCDLHQMKEIRANFNPDPIITPILERYKVENEKRKETQRQIDEQGFALRSDALIGRLASAVAWTLMVKETADLSIENDDLVEDEFLESGFETRMSEVEEVVFAFECLGINRDRIQGIIGEASRTLPGNPLFSLPLIKQGYREYHQNMVDYSELMEDKVSADFHRNRLESLGDWTVLGMAGNLLFPGISMFKENEPDLDSLKIYQNKLKEVDSDLRNDLIDAIRNPKEVEEIWDAPF